MLPKVFRRLRKPLKLTGLGEGQVSTLAEPEPRKTEPISLYRRGDLGAAGNAN